MKYIVYILLVILLFSLGCKEDSNIDQANRDESTLKFIPENPGSKDEISLIVFDDCKYNTLSKSSRTGKTINIEKQFNSMMKWPCVLHNDTILIGKLPQGTYNVNYTLIDISQQAPKNISYSTTLQLAVGK